MTVSEAKRLKELEAANTRLKKLPAGQMFEIGAIKDAQRKKWLPHRHDGSWCSIW